VTRLEALCAAVVAAGRELLLERRAVALVLELWPGATIIRQIDKSEGA
jgi:hypothetical protein